PNNDKGQYTPYIPGHQRRTHRGAPGHRASKNQTRQIKLDGKENAQDRADRKTDPQARNVILDRDEPVALHADSVTNSTACIDVNSATPKACLPNSHFPTEVASAFTLEQFGLERRAPQFPMTIEAGAP